MSQELDICELMLCESERLILRPNLLYRFTVDEECERCKQIANTYEGWRNQIKAPVQKTKHIEIN